VATISFVACSKTKRGRPSPAALLYDSALYRKSLLYALSRSDEAYILSAKHGALSLGTRIEPYDLTIKNFTRHQKIEWAAKVTPQLRQVLTSKDTAVFVAGRDYYFDLIPEIARIGCRVEIPLTGLSFGRRVKALKALNGEEYVENLIRAFYAAMRELYASQEGGRLLAECTGRMQWPNRGVYFLVEDQVEARCGRTGLGMPRVTRVGTHAVSLGSKTTLWDRISTHRGTSEGGGSHRSSIFRLHTGRALLNAQSALKRVESWGIGQVSPSEAKEMEKPLEREVSRTLGAMRVLWLDVGDAPAAFSDRAYIERNAIGALSRYNVSTGDIPDTWLGNYSAEYRIAVSGLWNLNHLFIMPDAAFLEVLRHYVDVTIGRRPAKQFSIAPPNWYGKVTAKVVSAQLSFLADVDEE
jgi:hypothetical protein